MTLKDTVEDMLSDDWRRRLQAEWNQLNIRMEQLDNFRDRFRRDEIDFVPRYDERQLCDQLRAMRMYRDMLLGYSKLVGVELDQTIYDDSYIWDWANFDKGDQT